MERGIIPLTSLVTKVPIGFHYLIAWVRFVDSA